MSQNLRTVMKKQGDEWITVRLENVSIGDTFIILDDGVRFGDEWIAMSEPTLRDGVWGINAKAKE